jgi:hypothetical protein
VSVLRTAPNRLRIGHGLRVYTRGHKLFPLFMGSAKISTTMSQKASNGLVQQAVKSDKNAIGYVSLAFTAGANSVTYNGVPCTLRNAKSGQYGGVRNFFMVTRGPATGAAKTFIRWVRKNPVAKQITSGDWVPLSEMVDPTISRREGHVGRRQPPRGVSPMPPASPLTPRAAWHSPTAPLASTNLVASTI